MNHTEQVAAKLMSMFMVNIRNVRLTQELVSMAKQYGCSPSEILYFADPDESCPVELSEADENRVKVVWTQLKFLGDEHREICKWLFDGPDDIYPIFAFPCVLWLHENTWADPRWAIIDYDDFKACIKIKDDGTLWYISEVTK